MFFFRRGMVMEPMKRMSITIAVIMVIAILALGAVYMMARKLEKRAEVRSVLEESGETTLKEEVAMEPSYAGESRPESESTIAESPAVEPSAEIPTAEGSKTPESPDPTERCDIIQGDDFLKYLKIKDSVFAVYRDNRILSDMMLDQERRWSPDLINKHMWILMEMKLKKKKALKEAEFAEKRFHYISNALMEWVLRTNEIVYEKKYIGEEDFYSKKVDPIVPCEENDQLFMANKENILKTFMGDFELVDY